VFGGWGKAVVVGPAVTAALLLCGQAAAETTDAGGSKDGAVVVDFDGFGHVDHVDFEWIVRCPHAHVRFRAGTRLLLHTPPAPGSFAAKGRYTDHGHGYRFLISAAIRGRDHPPSPDSEYLLTGWTGTLKVSARVFHHGKFFDRCRSGNLHWESTVQLNSGPVPVTGSLQMTGDPGEYISGGGGSYDYTAPPTPFTATAVGPGITLTVGGPGGWRLRLATSAHEQLHVGTYPNASRFGNTGNQIDITGYGRGCNETTGEFTVNAISYDRYQRIVSADVSFEQHCEGGPAALRGRFVLNRSG